VNWKTDQERVVGFLVGKVRLRKWFITAPSTVKERIIRDVTQLVLARKPKESNFLEYQGKVIWVVHPTFYPVPG
jgi:hypothetical protein